MTEFVLAVLAEALTALAVTLVLNVFRRFAEPAAA
jgi:hypothetical protein